MSYYLNYIKELGIWDFRNKGKRTVEITVQKNRFTMTVIYCTNKKYLINY